MKNPMRILVRLVLNWKFVEIISRFCATLSAIGCACDYIHMWKCRIYEYTCALYIHVTCEDAASMNIHVTIYTCEDAACMNVLMPHVWMRQATCIHESCLTHKWVSYHTFESVMANHDLGLASSPRLEIYFVLCTYNRVTSHLYKWEMSHI